MKECCCAKKRICQSCSMPLREEALCGTNADGSKNEEYCIYCFKEGKFTEPDLTQEQIIEKGVQYLVKEQNIELSEAKRIMQEATRNLKRWQK